MGRFLIQLRINNLHKIISETYQKSTKITSLMQSYQSNRESGLNELKSTLILERQRILNKANQFSYILLILSFLIKIVGITFDNNLK